MAPSLAKVAPSNSIKVPKLGHILRKNCPSWGTSYENSAPAGAHIAEKCPGWGKTHGKVPLQGQILRKMCPKSRNSYTLFAPHFLLPPSKILYLPLHVVLVFHLGKFESEYGNMWHRSKQAWIYILSKQTKIVSFSSCVTFFTLNWSSSFAETSVNQLLVEFRLIKSNFRCPLLSGL